MTVSYSNSIYCINMMMMIFILYLNSPVAVAQLLSASKLTDCVHSVQQSCQIFLHQPKQVL